jgi:hypothetical protein
VDVVDVKVMMLDKLSPLPPHVQSTLSFSALQPSPCGNDEVIRKQSQQVSNEDFSHLWPKMASQVMIGEKGQFSLVFGFLFVSRFTLITNQLFKLA